MKAAGGNWTQQMEDNFKASYDSLRVKTVGVEEAVSVSRGEAVSGVNPRRRQKRDTSGN